MTTLKVTLYSVPLPVFGLALLASFVLGWPRIVAVLLYAAIWVWMWLSSRLLDRFWRDYYREMPLRPDDAPFDRDAPTVTRAEIALYERRQAMSRHPAYRFGIWFVSAVVLLLTFLASLVDVRAMGLFAMLFCGCAMGFVVPIIWHAGDYYVLQSRVTGQDQRSARAAKAASRCVAAVAAVLFAVMIPYAASIWWPAVIALAAGVPVGVLAGRRAWHWAQAKLWPA